MSRPRRIATAVVAASLLAPVVAFAGPTIGVAYGTNSNLATGDGGIQPFAPDASGGSLGVFARVHLAGVLSLQGEASKVSDTSRSMDPSITMRSATALLVAELGHGALVPVVLAGIGIDNASMPTNPFVQGDNPSESYTHHEVGVGVELHTPGGLVIGVDMRAGTRSGPAQQPPYAYEPPCGAGMACPGDPYLISPPATFTLGDYHSFHVTLGARF